MLPQPILCDDVSSWNRVDEFDGVVDHKVAVTQDEEVVVGAPAVGHGRAARFRRFPGQGIK